MFSRKSLNAQSLTLLLIVAACFSSLVNATSVKEVVKGKQKIAGFFDIYYDQSKARALLSIEQFNQPFILATSLPYGLGSNDIGLDRGLQGGSQLVYFRRVGQRVFLVEDNTYYRANSDNAAERESVEQAFAESTLAGFEIIASNDSQTLIDVTNFVVSDLMGVSERIKSRGQGSFSFNKGLSSIDPSVIKAFPKNTELQAILTFKGSNAGRYLRSVSPSSQSFTLRQRVSLIQLPDDNYRPRAFHPFSGYWSNQYVDYASSLLETKEKRFIPRHRLVKKDPSATVSEAVEPIVYYVDHGAPENVRNALIEGASWWNQAFESAGYKDAFQVKLLTDDIDPMDIRYNVILWVHRATRGWSYGASVTDPRTGEILKGHVTLGSLRVRQDLLIAQGLTSPFDGSDPSQKIQVEMALARIRQLSAHEVGHTLGIAHNFAASVNKRASVMDYPHPYVTLSDDNKIDLSRAYATDIGDWDKQVIKYGYSDFYGKNETAELRKIIIESKNQGLKYISDPDARPNGGLHSEAHLWDNGSNAADELIRMSKVRKTALNNFNKNVIADDTPYSELEEVLVPIYNIHRFQVIAAAKLLGGSNYQYAVKGQDDFVQSEVTKEDQTKALNALLDTLSSSFLTLPEHIRKIIPPKAYGYSRNRESFSSKAGMALDPLSIAEGSANQTLSLIMNNQRLTRLAQQAARNNLSAHDVLTAISNRLFKSDIDELGNFQVNARVIQVYLRKLVSVVSSNASLEAKSAAISQLDRAQRWLKRLAGKTRKTDERYGYYRALQIMLSNQLEQLEIKSDSVRLPPGSPIG
ncbi:MAG: zinc-dependent metalloprotease [Kangiellaceae bacterium]|jgi:hypothetical protein|nr:zinc-dependent metalloprotease [Kangiellaceae bacterium]